MAAEHLRVTDPPWRVEPDIRTEENRHTGEVFEYIAGWDIVNGKECVVGCEGIVPGPNAEGDAHLMSASHELLAALEAMLRRDMRNTCQHEVTYRGGVLWEICSMCGSKWADDEGGKPEWKDPPEWAAAQAAIDKARGR